MDAKADTLNRLRLTSANSGEEVQCPSCKKKLQPYEVAQHFQQEVERLRQAQPENIVTLDTPAVNGTEGGTGEEQRKPWSVFRRVQRNRQSRQKQRTRKRPTPPPLFPCPVCNTQYAQSEIQRHTEQCLRRSNGRDENSSNEEEDGDEYEEYEWAGQKRIRVSSLLQGGYASIGVGQTLAAPNSSQQPDDEDEDLNVDEDDTQIYGPTQYGENDVIAPAEEQRNGTTPAHDDEDVTNYMRRLIASSNQTVPQSSAQSAMGEEADSAETASDCTPNEASLTQTQSSDASESPPPHSSGVTTPQQIIDALKAKLRYYENQVQGKFKCLICLDDYRNPAISVSCWHVHCEQCWLRSLGVRKLCPQCNLITTPRDLRRIYM